MPGRGSIEGVGNRRCQSCVACCTHLPIPAGLVSPGAKPAGVPCPHICPTGCRAYARRPQMCVDFRCAWFGDPSWPERWRPDRCALLCLRQDLDGKVPAAAVYETQPQARRQSVAQEILAELVRTVAVVVVIDTEGRRWQVPGHWLPHTKHEAVPPPHFLRRPAPSTPLNPL